MKLSIGLNAQAAIDKVRRLLIYIYSVDIDRKKNLMVDRLDCFFV